MIKLATQRLPIASFILENMAEGVIAADEKGSIIYTNPASDRMYGYGPGELNGRDVSILYPTIDTEENGFLSQIKPELQTVGSWQGEMTNVKKDGQHFRARARYSRYTNEDQNYWIGLQEIITESKLAEEALRESEQKFSALFQGMPVPVYAWQRSGEDFVLVDHNQAADAITGGAMGNFLGMTAAAMYPDRPDIVEDLSRCFAEKVSIQREMTYRYRTTGDLKQLFVKYAFIPPDLILVHTEDVTQRRQEEEARRDSESRLDLAVSGSNGGLWCIATDPDDPLTLPDEIYLSPRLKGFLGYKDGELPNSMAAWESHVHPEDLRGLQEISRKYRLGQIDQYEHDYRIRHKDGGIRCLHTTGRIERDRDGRPMRFAGIDWDITTRKQADEALRYQATLLKSVTDAVITTDLDFTIRSWNSAAEYLYGWRAEEVIGKSMEEVVPIEYPDDEPEAILAQFQAEGIWQGEVIQRNKDGSDICVLASVIVVRDEAGQPISVLAVNRNITDLKKAVEEASYEQGLMRTLLEHTPDFLYFKDRDRKFVRASNSFRDLFNLDMDEIIGKRDEDLFPPEVAAETFSDDRTVIETGTPLIDKEEGGESIGGEEHWFLTTKLPWYDAEGNIIGLFGISREFTERKRTEEQLRFQAQLLDSVRESVVATDLDGRVIYWGKGAEVLYGYRAEKVTGQLITFIVEPQEEEEEQERMRRVLETGLWQGQYLQKRNDGSSFWADTVISLVIDEAGQPRGYIGIDRDITDLNQALETASYEQSLMHTLLENTPDYIYFKDKDRRFVRASSSFSELFARDLGEILGKRDEDLFPPDVASETISDDRQVIETGTALIGKEEGSENIGGEPAWVITTKLPWYNSDGKIVGLFGISTNITERRIAVEKLRESEAIYRDLVERISDVIYSVDPGGAITYVNPAVESLLGLPPEQVVGQPFSQFVHSEELGRLQENIQILLSGSAPGPSEYRILTASGKTRWVRVTNQPMMEEERVIGIQGVLTDITERRKMERHLEEEAATAERDRLARRLHDAITQTLFSASVIAEATPRIWSKDPAQAQRNMEKLTEMLRGAMAEMRTMVIELRPDAVSGKTVGQLLKTLVEANQPRIDFPVTFIVEGDFILPENVTIAIYRVAQEAFHNVVQHAEATEVNIELKGDQESVTLNIRDNGRGFDQYMNPAGHFGLNIMSDRLDRVGGNLVIESEPGAGTQVVASWAERGNEEES